ncbi:MULTISPECIES: hypothetical protein [Pseudomonas]|uniref:hypothetical protein n=1 Tax=Pseudomonas TaxID=286 RepID=UPI0006D46071|nr:MULTISPECIES: hypothetical protein [Pseudomonas]
MSGILHAVNFMGRIGKRVSAGKPLKLRSDYYSPGYIVVLTAHLRRYNIPKAAVTFVDARNAGYFSSMGLSKALWGDDDYAQVRRKAGAYNAPLTHLDSRDAVDDATQQINGCLRKMAANSPYFNYKESEAFKELMHVVGELHDNVWSHGMERGFSAAQRAKSVKKGEIEFALADTGLGFLGELLSSGIARKYGITNDRQAIEWCIQEGNSSKLVQHQDDWGQALPDGHVGDSPYGGAVATRSVTNGNHHQGLGLAKLISLARRYEAELYIVSGTAILQLEKGKLSFKESKFAWKGVAISLTLQESKMAQAKAIPTSAEIDDIMNQLRG